MKTPTLLVVICSHNGEAYIEELLLSITAQLKPQDKIYIFDDHSEDSTIQIARKYTPNVIVEGFGIPGRNFLNALRKIGNEDFDVVALADQDDIWLEFKREHIFQNLDYTSPHLYVGKALSSKNLSQIGYEIDPEFYQIAFENRALGCNLAMNKPALDLINRIPTTDILYHDWWIHLILSTFGNVTYAQKATLIYRIHENNTIGIPTLKVRIKKYAKSDNRHNFIRHVLEMSRTLLEYLKSSNEETFEKPITNAAIIKFSNIVELKYTLIISPKTKFRSNNVENFALKIYLLFFRFHFVP